MKLPSLFFIGIICLSCVGKKEPLPMVFPGDTWIEKQPGELGIDSQKMQEALDYLASESGEDGLEEVFIARNGYVVYRGDSIYKKHNIYSSSKSFTSTVLGILTDQGMLSEETFAKEIDTALAELYPEVRLKHFASMTSGYSGNGESRWNEPSADWSWTPYAIDSALFVPGSEYAYWDEAQMMFGRLLTMKARKSLKSIFDEKIGKTIGLGEYEWGTEQDPNLPELTINNGCTGVMINAEQLARFGHFYLNEGNWNGQRLLSREWIGKATQNQVFTDEVADTDRSNVDGRGCYGYNWWVNGEMPTGKWHMPDAPKSLYYASGLHNNMCFVIPEWNMVFVRRGEDGNPAKGKPYVYNSFFKRMALAIKD
ncbi:serine hydrolase [Flavobacteriaceae bacterium TP-CH-4]|uniref:Serine hydrolase n=1 Tax=Pelagihabitans pacificus TaxID=2696054 RepID=A0A967E5K6_9FLAO|nr:serine hydrolase [Pelagihabitans pacificus]NHF59537.1 serine hydrolase [Pelagihabitans pacificus]